MEMPNTLSRQIPSTLSSEYLSNLNDMIVDQIIQLHLKCTHYKVNTNKIYNQKTGRCVDISGKIGQSIISHLVTQANTSKLPNLTVQPVPTKVQPVPTKV
jgi:hypothetical protein